jgi:hypothetical protein
MKPDLKHEDPGKNEFALSDPAAAGLELGFAEKKHGFWALFFARSADFSPAAAGSK